MNFICKCCMQWVYCRASAAYFCFSWQARRKKMPIWILWNPSSSGKGTSESLSLLSLSFIILFFYTAYRLALHFLPPPFYCLVFSVSLCSDLRCYSLTSTLFYSVFLLFFFRSFLISLSLVSVLWGSFGSEMHFGARLRQNFTLIKRMVGRTMRAAWGYFSS